MTYSLRAIFVGLLLALSFVVVACGTTATGGPAPANPLSAATPFPQSNPTDQPLPTSTPRPVATATPEIIPSPSPQPTVTLVQAQTPEPVTLQAATAVPTEAPTPTTTPTAAPAPTAAPTPAPTAKPTPTPSPTPKWVRPTGYDIFAPGGLHGDCESDPEPVFSAHITDLSLMDSLEPAGTVQGGDLKPHGYLGNKPSSLEVPVYAPVDSYLLDYAYYGQGDDAIYMFKFQVSCEVAYYFDHLRSVVSKIQELLPDYPAGDSRGTPVYPPVFFRAGDLIGYTGGTSMSQNWDFGVLNTQVWNDLPPVETYNYSPNVEKYRFAVCQYQYFQEDLREEYMAMLGAQGCGP